MVESGSVGQMGITDVARAWLAPVVMGLFLIAYAFVVLSFTIETVWAVAVLLGSGLVIAGIFEIAFSTLENSWRWLFLIVGIIDVALGLIAFGWPDTTFLVLSRLVAWVLLFRGIGDLLRAFEERRFGLPDWWFLATLGGLNIVMAIWASRYVGRSIVLLVLWVGIALMTRGFAAIAVGLAIRRAGNELVT